MKKEGYKYKIYTHAVLFLQALYTLAGCTLENGEDFAWYDKEAMLVNDLNSTIHDYTGMAIAGFQAWIWDNADENERIVLENTVLEGYTFTKREDKWQVEGYWNKYYIDLDYTAEGEMAGILIARRSHVDMWDVAVFDTCRMVPAGKDIWDLKVQAALFTDYNLYNTGAATLKMEIKEYKEKYPVLFHLEGEGAYETRKLYNETLPLEVDWKMKKGVLATHYYYITDYKYYIKAGIKGEEKSIIEVESD